MSYHLIRAQFTMAWISPIPTFEVLTQFIFPNVGFMIISETDNQLGDVNDTETIIVLDLKLVSSMGGRNARNIAMMIPIATHSRSIPTKEIFYGINREYACYFHKRCSCQPGGGIANYKSPSCASKDDCGVWSGICRPFKWKSRRLRMH